MISPRRFTVVWVWRWWRAEPRYSVVAHRRYRWVWNWWGAGYSCAVDVDARETWRLSLSRLPLALCTRDFPPYSPVPSSAAGRGVLATIRAGFSRGLPPLLWAEERGRSYSRGVQRGACPPLLWAEEGGSAGYSRGVQLWGGRLSPCCGRKRGSAAILGVGFKRGLGWGMRRGGGKRGRRLWGVQMALRAAGGGRTAVVGGLLGGSCWGRGGGQGRFGWVLGM